MKKITIILLAAIALISCNKNIDVVDPMTPDLNAPILVTAGVEATTEVDTKAPVTGTSFPATATNIFRLTAFQGTAVPTNYTTTYFDNIQVNSSSSTLSLATDQYYPTNGDKVYFYAFAPEATSVVAGNGTTAPVAKYTINGTQDIMAAKHVTGIAKAVTSQPQPALPFTHKLKQLNFKIMRDGSFLDGKAVTSIIITGAKTNALLNIITGDLTWEATTGNITVGAASTNITTTATTFGSPVMIEPGASFNMTIVADGVTYTTSVSGLSDSGAAGKSYLITLTFKRQGIIPTSSITDWAAGTAVNKDII